ncbi:hypothetical protein Q5741_10515 [Paenibacillus sp. JX-17]|uniref:Uncharacterized protein n=1 Tax=Paenibacillus lacisoli TaxID=3064525 RepID=A0ABT9CC67_9BACL|nr:hypothetical protein [Paenibacillus sp. JX-17]MDO7906858.1 hypothetical protein [Paenibacillus sp. JX-17]
MDYGTRGSLWMTDFLRSSEQEKKKRIQEAKKSNDLQLMASIHFHLSLRNQQDLIELHQKTS